MSLVGQALVVAVAVSTVAFTSTAMAGQGGTPGANPTAPGQAGTSPGQVWKSEKNDPSIESPLSPGQQYNQDGDAITDTPPPGKTFDTPGKDR
jgi:hypothetical protein